MSRRFAEEDHAAYARLVEVLLPAAHGMPAGNATGVAEGGLDAVLKLRPEIAGDLLRGIRLFGASGDLAALQADAEAWHAVRLCAYGAYYTTPAVQAILHYSGQSAQPFDPEATAEYLADGLLAPVISRGPIWTVPPE